MGSAATIQRVRSTAEPLEARSPKVDRDGDPRVDGGMPNATAGRYRDMIATTVTTLLSFIAFFIQGVIVARVLGPEARGEFGKILYFPRDLLLYVGLLGSLDAIAALAAGGRFGKWQLRRAAWRLAWTTSVITLVVSLAVAAVVFWGTGKLHLLPFCALIALFLPLEHTQLVMGAVDRGCGDFYRYNWQRLFYAFSFPIVLSLFYGTGATTPLGISNLMTVCILFVGSRWLGVLPTWLNLWRREDRRGADGTPGQTAVESLSTCQLLKRGRPYALSLLATECFERLDLLLIVLLATFVEAGFYFVAVPAAALLTIVPNALSAFAFNAGAKPDFHLTRASVVKYLSLILMLQVVAALIAWGTFPTLIRVIFGSDFEPAIDFALLLLPANALRGYLQFADAFLRARGRSHVGIRVRLSSIVVMLVFVGLTFNEWRLISIPLGAAVGQLWSSLVITIAVFRESCGGVETAASTEETKGRP